MESGYKSLFDRVMSGTSDADDIPVCTSLAEANDPDAAYALAVRYINSGENDELSFKWALKAYEAGHKDMYLHLGKAYLDGKGTAKDPQAAVEILSASVSSHDAEGMYYYGRALAESGLDDSGAMMLYESYKLGYPLAAAYLTDNYVPQTKSVIWRTFATQLGSVPAKYDTANAYEKGQGVEMDEKKAFDLYTECAKAGYTDAIYRLGAYYESRHCTAEALDMYAKAEQAGHPSARARANAMRAAIEKAQKLYELAQAGDAKAQFQYGQCCEDGKGIEKNPDMAFQWYLRSAHSGNVKAQFKVGQCYESGMGTSIDPSQAIEWYLRATHADKPYSIAFYRLYEIYSEGIIVMRDPVYAKKCLIDSANYGYTVASLLVAQNYEHGENGFDKSIPEAAKYYMKAQECNNSEAAEYVNKMLSLANSGDPEAQYFAWAYYTKKERKHRSERAISYLEQSARAGYQPAMQELGLKTPPQTQHIVPESPIPPHVTQLSDEEKAQIQKLEGMEASAQTLYDLGCVYRDAALREKNDNDLYVKAAMYFKQAGDLNYAPALFEFANCLGSGHGIAQSYEDAFKYYNLAYEAGEIRALTSMGIYYLRGRYVEMDKIKALEYFEKAAEAGDPEALYRLGKYYGSHGVDEKSAYAFELCMRAAQSGHAKAQLFIGTCYENGRGTEQDMDKALYWYKSAADMGLTTADYAIAVCYEKGKGVEKDEAKAFQIYMSAAMRENTSAQFRIACMYEHGVGVEENPYEAFRWYYIAAEKGNYKALHALGNCYEFGIGVVKDINAAIAYYEQAATHGNSWSQYRLCVYYTSGLYTERNPDMALYYCKLAAENKSAFAQYRMGRWCEKGFIVDQDMRKAVAYYRMAADQGNPAAQCALATALEEGNGVQKNITEAISLYGKAAHMNYAPALYRLGLCCESGYGIELDLSEALSYYEKAAALGYPAAAEKIRELLI